MKFNNTFQFQRGEIYLVKEHEGQGHEQKKTRPWVLVGSSQINRARGTLLAVPLSTKAPHKPPLSIQIYSNNMLVSAVIDQLRALDKSRFLSFEGILSLHEMSLINDGLRQVLSL